MQSSAGEQAQDRSGPYEWVDGGTISDALRGTEIPVPPRWMNGYTVLPHGTDHATLSRSVAHWYPAAARDVCVAYVRDWPRASKYGYHLLLVGGRDSWRVRKTAGAATVNEIVMRYASRQDVSQEYVSVPILRGLLPLKKSRYDAWAAFRSKVLGVKLLFVDDPHTIPEDSEERWFFEDLYDIRSSRRLPTITSISSASPDDDLRAFRNVLGYKAADVVETYGKYIAKF